MKINLKIIRGESNNVADANKTSENNWKICSFISEDTVYMRFLSPSRNEIKDMR